MTKQETLIKQYEILSESLGKQANIILLLTRRVRELVIIASNTSEVEVKVNILKEATIINEWLDSLTKQTEQMWEQHKQNMKRIADWSFYR